MAEVELTTIPPMQDAIENFLIGWGMGWDLNGLMQGLVDALPADSVCKDLVFLTDADKQERIK